MNDAFYLVSGQSPPEVEATPYFEDNEELNPDIGHTKQVKDDKTKGKNDEGIFMVMSEA